MNTNPPEDLLKRLRQGNRFLLTSHANPDGDAVGSEMGLARILRGLGKGVAVWNRDPTPSVYSFLPGADRITIGTEPPPGFPERFDAIVPLECPSLERTGLEEALLASGLPFLNIDHHLGNQLYGAVNWVDSGAPAVGAMVYRLARALHTQLDAETATALYLTLVTDTGGFRFSNATPEAFEAAATLVREGARPEKVAGWLYESRPAAAVHLLGEVLRTLELHAEGKVATVLLTREMLERTGATDGDGEGLTNYPRSIAGVEAASLIRERGEGQYKVSLRSRGQVNVEAIASRHGGGGHRNAAGFEMNTSAEEVRRTVVDALAAALREEAASPAPPAETDIAEAQEPTLEEGT